MANPDNYSDNINPKSYKNRLFWDEESCFLDDFSEEKSKVLDEND